MSKESLPPPASAGLSILVTDDSRANRILLAKVLEDMGHRVLEAASGEEALEQFRQHAPDVVLMDVVMPGMDGYEAVREIRRVATEWVPIIFISATGETGNIVRGMESGGDDYLSKPFDLQVLHAKIDALRERLWLTRQLERQNRLLQDYQAKNEEEQSAAQNFMRRLSELDKINDPLVRFHLQPAENFSGDLIAVARAPGNHLHVLLADSTGHGLTAALAGMPVLQLFHTMTAKGFSIGGIATEINRKIKAYLPANRFVAAILLSLDTENRMLSVWNGGCPPAVLLDPHGVAAYQFNSMHLPLGILDPERFDADVERYFYGDNPCQMLLCSDGAVDTADPSSMVQGMSHLLDAMYGRDAGGRLPAMLELLRQKLAGKPAHDDIAMILVDCPPDEVLPVQVADEAPHAGDAEVAVSLPHEPLDIVAENEWQFSLTLTAPQLRNFDIVPMVLDLVKQLEREIGDLSSTIFLVLSELINNALDHGLLRLDSALKHDPEGMERYFDERITRLKNLDTGEIRIGLNKVVSVRDACLKIVIAHTGEGFDYRALLEALPDAGMRRHGRGIALVKNLSGVLNYADNGREVHVCLPLLGAAQCETSRVSKYCKIVQHFGGAE